MKSALPCLNKWFSGPLNRLLILFLSFTLSSCFDVIDEIKVNKDGSGEFLLTMNFSKSKSKISSIMHLDTFRGYKIPTEAEVEEFIDELVVSLQKSKGITDVKRTVDFEEFIFTLGFSFASAEDINHAIENLSVKIGGQSKSFNLRYSYNESEKKFTRYYELHKVDRENYNKLEQDDKTMVNTAAYISISRFDLEVADCSHVKAKISKSGNAVMIRTSAMDIIKGNSNLTYTVNLK